MFSSFGGGVKAGRHISLRLDWASDTNELVFPTDQRKTERERERDSKASKQRSSGNAKGATIMPLGGGEGTTFIHTISERVVVFGTSHGSGTRHDYHVISGGGYANRMYD